MSRYDRSYDYGLRGSRETMRPSFQGGYGSYGGRGYAYDPGYDERGGSRLPNRVTASYNADYVYGARGPRYPVDYNMYTGDRMDRNGDYRYYRQPYITRAGSWTMRGSSHPTGYDYPDYGPNYGGRYPDELY